MPPTNNIFPLFLTSRGPTVAAIQQVLQRIGEATSGTKDVLQTRLLKSTAKTKMPDPFNQRRQTRILSIDMGIRNLAYCVADAHLSTPNPGAAKMDVLAWRRMDLSEAFRKHGRSIEEDEDPFTPENLSWMATWFLWDTLGGWKPDIILIERQRWRSSSGPSIQQWTVRVNSLEAIMWGVLTALSDAVPKWWTFGVDPKRVGHFWLDDQTSKATKKSKIEEQVSVNGLEDGKETGTGKTLSRGKAEKKAKMQLLRTWLDSDNPSTALSATKRNPKTDDEADVARHPKIAFSFWIGPHNVGGKDYGADATRQALLYATDTPSERVKRANYLKEYVKKVDDITDCFLQAAAWVAWEENLKELKTQAVEFQKEVADELGIKEFSNMHLAEFVQKLQDGRKKVVKKKVAEMDRADADENKKEGVKPRTKRTRKGVVEDDSDGTGAKDVGKGVNEMSATTTKTKRTKKKADEKDERKVVEETLATIKTKKTRKKENASPAEVAATPKTTTRTRTKKKEKQII